MKRISLEGMDTSCLDKYGVDLSEYGAVCCCPGERLTVQGEKVDFFYMVLKGRAKVFVSSENGRTLMLAKSESGDVVSEAELVRYIRTAMATTIAETYMVCLAVPMSRAEYELTHNIKFSNEIAKVISEKLFDSSNNCLSTAVRTGEQRLCEYLLLNAKDNILQGTLTDAADSIGISYRHLCRMMKALTEEGTVAKIGGKYYIKDGNTLAGKAY